MESHEFKRFYEKAVHYCVYISLLEVYLAAYELPEVKLRYEAGFDNEISTDRFF